MMLINGVQASTLRFNCIFIKIVYMFFGLDANIDWGVQVEGGKGVEMGLLEPIQLIQHIQETKENINEK